MCRFGRKTASQPCLSPLSPLLYGPFLMSPRNDQNTTSRFPHPNSRAPISNRRNTGRSALAPELPQVLPRGGVPPRLSSLSRSLAPLSTERRVGGEKLSPSRFTHNSVSDISTQGVSIYDPFIPRWTQSLDPRPPFGILFLAPNAAIDRNPAPPRWDSLLRLSLTSVWSDRCRHWLLLTSPVQDARTTVFDNFPGLTRHTDCASVLFPVHVCHSRLV